jgi:hypothetical protein
MFSQKINEEMEEYLTKHNIQSTLQTIIIQLCIDKPRDPIQFMINYLNNKLEFSKDKEVMDSIEKNDIEKRMFERISRSSFPSINISERRGSTSSISMYNHDLEINQMAPKRRGAISDAPPSGSNDNIQLKSEEVYRQLENTLKENPTFSHLDVEERRELCNRMIMVKFSKNQEVIRQGKSFFLNRNPRK